MRNAKLTNLFNIPEHASSLVNPIVLTSATGQPGSIQLAGPNHVGSKVILAPAGATGLTLTPQGLTANAAGPQKLIMPGGQSVTLFNSNGTASATANNVLPGLDIKPECKPETETFAC